MSSVQIRRWESAKMKRKDKNLAKIWGHRALKEMVSVSMYMYKIMCSGFFCELLAKLLNFVHYPFKKGYVPILYNFYSDFLFMYYMFVVDA